MGMSSNAVKVFIKLVVVFVWLVADMNCPQGSGHLVVCACPLSNCLIIPLHNKSISNVMKLIENISPITLLKLLVQSGIFWFPGYNGCNNQWNGLSKSLSLFRRMVELDGFGFFDLDSFEKGYQNPSPNPSNITAQCSSHLLFGK